MKMRDLSAYEIEMVSGAGWDDWFGSVRESISSWFSMVQNFFSANSNIPVPTQAQFDIIQSNCMNGIQSVTTSSTGGSASLSLATKSGVTLTLTQGGGSFSFTCQPTP
jgi:hypothetical protein